MAGRTYVPRSQAVRLLQMQSHLRGLQHDSVLLDEPCVPASSGVVTLSRDLMDHRGYTAATEGM